MLESIVTIVLGIIIVIIGITHIGGNISLLHSYHRHRVKEEDILPFGKRVGIGTIICGGSLTAFGVLQLAFELTQKPVFTIIGLCIMIPGLIAGLVVTFYAMIKYNKGIF